jgi:hypothetical protein
MLPVLGTFKRVSTRYRISGCEVSGAGIYIRYSSTFRIHNYIFLKIYTKFSILSSQGCRVGSPASTYVSLDNVILHGSCGPPAARSRASEAEVRKFLKLFVQVL